MASKAAPNARPLHPCVLSVFEGNQGSEHSTWAHITTGKHELPNLVTAQNSSILIYSIEESTGKLLLEHSFAGLSGSICYLDSIPSPGDESDSLLIGFAGHPRLAVVSVTSAPPQTVTSERYILMANSLLDLTPALLEASLGSVTPLEQDLRASKEQKNPNLVTLAVILGGGVAVAAITLLRIKTSKGMHSWNALEPYLLPLSILKKNLKSSVEATAMASSIQNNPASNQQSIAHGFGDVISSCFLPGYLEPTIVLLHSNPQHGWTWSGRLGRPHGAGGTAYGLLATAMTVTVSHRQAAVLWSVAVPSDASKLYPIGKIGCLVVGPNEVFDIENCGRVSRILTVNGWAKSTCPAELLDQLQPNPWPLPRLSIQLDGSRLTFINDSVALVSLRNGQLYCLQHIGDGWNMMPLGRSLRGIGEVGDMITLPFGSIPKEIMQNLLGSKASNNLSMGITFVGSRIGDSTLLGYTLESGITLGDTAKLEGMKKRKIRSIQWGTNEETGMEAQEDEYEIIMRGEEEALYAPFGATSEARASKALTTPDVVPPSSDEEENEMASNEIKRKRERTNLVRISVLRSLTTLDTITALGPIGPGCEGPVSAAKPTTNTADNVWDKPKSPVLGGTAHVLPCGYGSSGGLALVTTPGRDDASILAEADCLNAQSIFSLPKRGIIVMGMTPNKEGIAGMSVLRMQPSSSVKVEQGNHQPSDIEFNEVDLESWSISDKKTEGTFADARYVLTQTTLLSASELHDGHILLLVKSDDGFSYALVILSEVNGKLQVLDHTLVESMSGGALLSVTPIERDVNGDLLYFGCVWSTGCATVATVANDNSVNMTMILGTVKNEADNIGEDEEEFFYQSDRITAIDVFSAAEDLFVRAEERLGSPFAQREKDILANDGFDEEELELYGDSGTQFKAPCVDDNAQIVIENTRSTFTSYIAVVRISGLLQVFKVSEFADGNFPQPVWETSGCGHGGAALESLNENTSATRKPRLHKMFTSEIRFFFCGTTDSSASSKRSQLRFASHPLYIAIETDSGDFHIYKQEKGSNCVFGRQPMRLSERPSKEQSRHHSKLRRKGILSKTAPDECMSDLVSFRHNRCHRFVGISGHDGLFAANARPLWLVSERGSLKFLHHRLRHVAPAGGRARPITGFCSGLKDYQRESGNGFVTLHERIGRVGSQRLTIFKGISNIFVPNGLMPGSGFSVQKVLFGVTIRRIQFIDDSHVSSGAHPLYAVLISREVEKDQSELNEDGMSAMERRRIKEERDSAKTKRQVEADLGGFDMEQEWVEEIEREDCFEVDLTFGGAPPVKASAYAVWIVDASNNWNVVDSYELGEFEHGLTMQVMSLTECDEEPGGPPSDNNDWPDTLFITVGTAIVDGDGEDVSSKGRILLFEVKREDEAALAAGSPVAELSLHFQKDVYQGPVTSLTCLNCEGRSRLVIGAGSDINVEQWGRGRLTQVGFFRAQMQILDIMLFKTFFLLSDAYDSLHFLVWRESDKSLTLLAKDYEPVPVFASGLMSRGGSMSFVVHDDRQNLQFFQYAPGDPAARGGNKLVCRADFHLGSQTVALQSHFCRSSLLINSATPTSTLAALKSQDSLFGRTDDDQRLGLHYGTSDGSFGAVVPLSEPVYWRLAALQSVMANALESNCALNPRAFRLYRRTPRRGGCRSNDRRKGVIDGDLVTQYCDLSLPDQEDLASAIGSTVDLILDNLVELRCSSVVL